MIRIFVVVNIRPYREGLVQLLDAREESIVVGAAATGRDAVERLDETAPDVALVDRGIPDLDELSIALAERSPRIPLAIVGIADPESDVLACAEMGISGYITPESSIDELVATLQSVADGELICSPRTAGVLMRRLAELANGSCRNGTFALLTRREREVAALMCENLSNKEIAIRLSIEVATVKNHVHNVLDKLRVHRRAEAVRLLAHPMRRLTVEQL